MEPVIIFDEKKRTHFFWKYAFVEMNKKLNIWVEVGEDGFFCLFLNQWPCLSVLEVWSAFPQRPNQAWFSWKSHAVEEASETLDICNNCTGRHRQPQGKLWSNLPVITTEPPGWPRTQGGARLHISVLSSTCCCACCSSMKWELANWSSRSRRPYLSGVPVLHFWPPLSPSSACEREGETSGYFLSKCSITDIKRSTAHHRLPQVRLHSGTGWCLRGPI